MGLGSCRVVPFSVTLVVVVMAVVMVMVVVVVFGLRG